MKKYLLTLLCAAAIAPLPAQTAYLETDFSEGIPDTFKLYDEDGLEPSIDIQSLGFTTGKPWIILTEWSGNRAAVSTSWYRKAGTSDDWMITTPFTVASPRAVLSWRAKSGDPDYRDGYSVYISDSALSPDDFKQLTPAFSTKNEKAEWTEREISLADYAGKQVRIAIVNNTRDRHTLWIDDLFAGVPASLKITSGISRVTDREGAILISGTLTNISEQDIKGYSICYRFGSGTLFEHKSNATVPAGKTVSFEFTSRQPISRNETLPYELTVRSGDDASSTSGLITCFLRRIVAEEVTGVWCGYCVRGIAAMKSMKELHPESFLGIAVHASSAQWEDPMDFTPYSDWLFESLGMPGYPHATVNRRKIQTGDPANIPLYYSQLQERELTAGLTLTVSDVDKDARSASLHTDVYFLNDTPEAQYTLAYVLIENNVHKDAVIGDDGKPSRYNGYEQNNYYGDGAMGECGGFEKLPKIIPGADMTYHDVARAFWGNGYDGLQGSLPAEVVADQAYGHDYTITLPDNIMHDENTEIAALLINEKTGEIINADVVPLQAWFTSIETPVTPDADIRFCVSGGALTLCSSENIDSVALFSIDGRQVLSATPAASEVSLDISTLQGIHILKATAGNSIITKKLTF